MNTLDSEHLINIKSQYYMLYMYDTCCQLISMYSRPASLILENAESHLAMAVHIDQYSKPTTRSTTAPQ